ncbi:OmpA-OmpF porin, OOP family [Aliiroseovarius halocynthiae]|uniref:OmpA family protein n=1 Tax=Aliiroseovarius halocynthiae TaxID=985055 RepID=A0A545SZG7_9RHOB|nr:OmpA family protein [Aliiroseovarius halocynthiae]TQV70364.1 OmpA family protein [Aliiroseovarius halocynthiae]SMR81942.1 OmpA-OmpF porin, OOP family [Aliiroseovarius halocynthiae]
MILSRHFLALASLIALLPVGAQALSLPAGSELQSETSENEQVEIATSRFDGGTVPAIMAVGHVNRQAWRVPGQSDHSYQILTSLREQLVQDGYQILYQCQAVSCGGFDFRFQIGHFQAPDMYIDLGDYHFLSIRKGSSFAQILISQSTHDTFFELTFVTPLQDDAPVLSVTQTTPVSAGHPTDPMGVQLTSVGRAVLSGLTFATGSSDLADGEVPALAELAAFLANAPDQRIVLVGHTDAEGSLEGNATLSRQRATSVMNRLINRYGVDANQLTANGVGYLAPLAGNATPEGRNLNRRVEAVLLNTE